MDTKSTETKEKTSVKSLKNFWEQKAVDAQKSMEKILPVVGDQLGGITKECEDSNRREAYNDINDRCERIRASDEIKDSDEPKDFDVFYAEYQKAAPKLKDLRNLGEYSPEASEQKAITNVDDIRNDKFERYGTLDRNAPCKKFAEHMSGVHFEKTMKCVADARSNSVVGEDEVQ